MLFFSLVTETSSAKNNAYEVTPAQAFEKYSNMVYRLAFVRTANKYDSEDILSEVFLRLVKNVGKIKSEEHLKAWLIRVTINCSSSLFAFKKRKNEVEYIETDGVTFIEDNSVLSVVLSLPEHQKTVIYMYYFEGYSAKEISKICSIPVGTVKSRLSRGRDALKAQLKGENFDV